MATGKRKSSSGRKNSSGKTNSRQKKKNTAQESFTEEIVLWIILAVSILLFISNFGIGGAVGNAVSGFFFGVFGLLAYLFPVIFIIGTFFAVSNKGNRLAAVKVASGTALVFLLCTFIELILHGSDAPGAVAAYRECSANKIGGGFLGGFFARLLAPNFGTAGSFVIVIIAMIICLVLITQRSAMRGVKKGSRRVYETAKESNERYREHARQQREERELKRMDRKVEGVAIDTRVLPEKKHPSMTDEVSEIHIDGLLDLPDADEIRKMQKETAVKPAAVKPVTPVPVSVPERTPAYKPEEVFSAPSAFSDEALQSMTPEIPEPVAPARPDPASAKYTEVYQEPQAVAEKPERKKKNTKPTEAEVEQDIASIEQEMLLGEEKKQKYIFPPISLLKPPENKQGDSRQHLQEM